MGEDINLKRLNKKLDELLAEAQQIKRHIEASILAEEFKDAGVAPTAETRRPVAAQSENLPKKPTMEAQTVLTFNSDGATNVETFALVQRFVVPRPGASEAELSPQKYEPPVTESGQNHPPDSPTSE